MKKLVLIRHAKSSWKDMSLTDFNRPLNGRGKFDGPLMASYLRNRFVNIDYLHSSSSIRTFETSKYFINQNIKKVAETLNIINKYYEGQFILRNKGLIRIFNKDNFKRKECVYLPARAFFKALNLKKNINL